MTQTVLTPERTYKSIHATSKKRVLEQGSHLFGKLVDDEASYDIFSAFIEREKKGSTAIGSGIAMPHSSSELVDSAVAVFFALNTGVDFEAADEKPVDLFLMMLVPSNECPQYAKVLSDFRTKLLQPGFADKLREAPSSEALYELLQEQGIT